MDREAALALQQAGMRSWVAAMAEASPGARLFERDGVSAIAAPACPDRSVVNSVSYADTDALITDLADLERFYDECGVVAWTVWTPEFDTDAIAALRRGGGVLDGDPSAMSLDLSRWDPVEIGDLEWDGSLSPADLGRVNDAAYGLTPEAGLARGLTTAPERFRLLRALVGDEPACVLGTIETGSDLGFYFVATDPAHRGRGLCPRLMAVALADAKRRGLETSSLQASKMGEPVYRRLGFDRDFTLNMFERRRG